MNENERETPMTDAVIEKPLAVIIHRSKQLERMCAELAERLEYTQTGIVSVTHNPMTTAKNKQALAKYTAMKDGKL